ncbi:MAG: hypothetical protein J6Z49_03400 [Kiritimatiellae bacterium]|nr:hypothetical protein [Kiritimatiellia bacterium]
MKKLAIIAIIAIAIVSIDGQADAPVVAQTIRADGTTNTWTQAELQTALGLVNRMYWRDMETTAGRERWHGKRVGAPRLDTNLCIQVWQYADGFAWTNAWTRPKSQMEREAEAAAREAARREAEFARLTNAVPGIVAQILAEREAASRTNVVTEVVGP